MRIRLLNLEHVIAITRDTQADQCDKEDIHFEKKNENTVRVQIFVGDLISLYSWVIVLSRKKG